MRGRNDHVHIEMYLLPPTIGGKRYQHATYGKSKPCNNKTALTKNQTTNKLSGRTFLGAKVIAPDRFACLWFADGSWSWSCLGGMRLSVCQLSTHGRRFC